VAAALNFFRQPSRIQQLQEAQLAARMQLVEWLQQKKVNPILAESFENSLHKLYKPAIGAEDRQAKDFLGIIERILDLVENKIREDDHGDMPKFENNLKMWRALCIWKAKDKASGGPARFKVDPTQLARDAADLWMDMRAGAIPLPRGFWAEVIAAKDGHR
jgi:hypothetical protein